MALYEFECPTCGERFEVSKPMHEHEELKVKPPACPRCGKPARELAPLINCKIPSG